MKAPCARRHQKRFAAAHGARSHRIDLQRARLTIRIGGAPIGLNWLQSIGLHFAALRTPSARWYRSSRQVSQMVARTPSNSRSRAPVADEALSSAFRSAHGLFLRPSRTRRSALASRNATSFSSRCRSSRAMRSSRSSPAVQPLTGQTQVACSLTNWGAAWSANAGTGVQVARRQARKGRIKCAPASRTRLRSRPA